ncbi:TetR/AcrR family transcriptional regulator [Nocardia panacis]|uniref:TetR/AcrR family transcriptional regulator n=1 Tax=Nocardia panacis TaxID=2340916 RepID=A0A3A4KGR2_9NOCA|nr:TetR/AcrR family transcriptional regulator [Nocardia panacis]RJO75188.1 TetR/AcrR family transcriptional regulator [Nocardia panacis]
MNPATTVPPPRRLRADAARNQQRIIAAARQLFAERGLEITLDDVAEKAGVGVGTVYRRFANKKALVAEVFEQNLLDFAEASEAALHNPDPWLGVVEFFEYACRHLAPNRGFGSVMLELKQEMDRFKQVLDNRIKPTTLAIVARAREAGVLAPGIEGGDFFSLIHMIASFADFASGVRPDAWERYVAIALNGVRSDSTPRRPLTVAPLTPAEVDQAKTSTCEARRRWPIQDGQPQPATQ